MTDAAVSTVTHELATYIAGAMGRDLPAEVAAKTRLHVLDTLAAMLSGSRLKPGELAASYVETLGGRPEATVIGNRHPHVRRQCGARQRHDGPRRRDRRLRISAASFIRAAPSCRPRLRSPSGRGSAGTT